MSYLAGGRLAWRNPPASDPARRWSTFVERQRAGSPAFIQLYDVAEGQELAPWQQGEKFTVHAAQDLDRRLRLWNIESGTSHLRRMGVW